jgi:hypothetical protein
MIDATLHWDHGRDWFNSIVYCERHADTIRETALGFTSRGGSIMLCGFTIGWRKVVIYPNTLSCWHSPYDNMPFTEEDRQRVTRTALSWLGAQGCIARVREGFPK